MLSKYPSLLLHVQSRNANTVEPLYCGHPWGYKKVSSKRGVLISSEVAIIHIYSNWDPSQCPQYRGCPYFRGVHSERFHCILIANKIEVVVAVMYM